MYRNIYIYTYADGLSLITPSHPQGASERSFLTNQPQGASLARESICICIYVYMYVYIYIYCYALFTPSLRLVLHTLSPKKSKSQKIDEFDFSIMCSGAQNRSKSNPLPKFDK